MSLDLTVIPLPCRRDLTEKSSEICSNYLAFDRDYGIFQQFKTGKHYQCEKSLPVGELQTWSLPKGSRLYIYRENGIRVNHTKYEGHLEYTLAREMKKIKIPKSTTDHNLGILAYIRKLHRNTPIILDWR